MRACTLPFAHTIWLPARASGGTARYDGAPQDMLRQRASWKRAAGSKSAATPSKQTRRFFKQAREAKRAREVRREK